MKSASSEVDAQLVPKHGESDLIKGTRNRLAIGMLVGSKMDDARKVWIEKLQSYAQSNGVRKRLPNDQVLEMAAHQRLTAATGMTVNLADSHSP